MGLFLLIIMAVLEIALAIVSCTNAMQRPDWRKKRMFVRVIQLAIAVIAIILIGQKWRVIPVIALLTVLALINLIMILAKRRKNNGQKKKAGAIASCIISIVLIGFALVPAILFTGYSGLPTTGEYDVSEASAVLVDSSRPDTFENDGSFCEVPVHFYYPKTDAETADKFPLIVFSHGAFGYYQSNMSTYMELASNGYVVAALDHPHHAMFTTDSSGKTVIVDRDFIATAMKIGGDDADEYTAEQSLEIYREWMDKRTADMDFAIDEIKTAAGAKSLDSSWKCCETKDQIQDALGMTDTTRIGLIGHSMGGAASVALGRTRDDVGAVVDLDGTMLSEYTGVKDGVLTVNEEPYPVPVLEFCNWGHYKVHQQDFGKETYANSEVINSASDGFLIGIKGTEHMDFTDLPMFSPILARNFGKGDCDSEEVMGIVNSETLKFFDCYLKGIGKYSPKEVY